MLHFNFDLLYLSPSLLKYLPEKTLNNEKDWEKSIKKIFSLENSDNNFFLPKTITNNYDLESVSHKGEGIGMSNIQSRLRMIYNQENLLKFSKNDGIFTVTIFIPL